MSRSTSAYAGRAASIYRSEFFDYSTGHRSSISETLDIVERGFERLGIPLNGLVKMTGIAPCKAKDPKPYADVTPAMLMRMVALTQKGLRQAEIASELGCSQSAVSKNLTRLGIRQRAHRRIPTVTHQGPSWPPPRESFRESRPETSCGAAAQP